MTLTTRLTLAMVLLALSAAAVVGIFTYWNLEKVILPVELARLQEHVRRQGARLDEVVSATRNDVKAFAAGAAALEGLVRARSNGGRDPAEGTAENIWRARLARRFTADLVTKPSYLQFRVIGIAGGGREILRVDRSGPQGAVRIVPDEELQSKGDRDYFADTMKLPPGAVYVSRIDLNQERGKIESPPVPVIRVATPIYSSAGEPFGILIINVDLRPVFGEVGLSEHESGQVYIVNEAGYYLHHPQQERTFGFQLGREDRLQDDFPELAVNLGKTMEGARSIRSANGDTLGVALLPLRPGGGPWMAIIETVPERQLLASIAMVRQSSLVAGASVAVLAALMAVGLAHSLTRPLVTLTRSVESFAEGGNESETGKIEGAGEIGVLARAFERRGSELRAKTSALHKSEHRFRALLEHSSDCITLINGDNKFVYASPSLTGISGYKPEEILGLDGLINTHPEDQILIHDLIRQLRAKPGQPIPILWRHRHKNGEWRWLEGTATNLLEDPAVQATVTNYRDITERKQTEEALRESEELFSKAFRLSPDCMVIIRLSDRTVVRANETVCRIWGSAPDEIIGRPTTDFTSWPNEEERLAFMRTLLEKGEYLNYETDLRLSDGRLVGFAVSTRLITLNGESCALSVMSDITGRKKAEATAAQLAAIVEFSEDGIIGKDLAGMITSWNTGAKNIFGYAADEMVGQTIMRLIPPDRHNEEAEILVRLRQGDAVRSFETLRVCKDGRIIAVSITVSAIKDASGQVTGASKIVRDITERKQAEAARRVSESRYRTLFDYAPDGIIIADGESRYLDANPSLCRMLGYTRDEFIGLHASDIVTRAELPHIAPALNAIKTSAGYHREWQLRRKDGSVFGAEVIATLMPDGNLMGMIRDVTERRTAELALRQKEMLLHAADRRLAEIVYGMTEACFALDEKWRFTFVNERSEALLHHRRDQMLGRPIWEVFSEIMGTPSEMHYRSAMTQRVPVSFEVFSPIAERWLDIRLFPTAEGLAAFILDIHERKQVEEALTLSRAQFKDLFENAPAGYHEVDADGRLARINQTELNMLGYTAEELLGKYVWEISSEEEISRRAVAEKLLGIVPLQAFERRLKRKDGSSFPVLIEDKLVQGPGGKITGIRSVIKDITERKEMELALRGNEERFRTMANSIPQLAWIARADGYIIWYNERWYEYTGTSAAQMEGWGWQMVHHPDALPRVLESWTRAIESNQKFEMEFPLRGADGQYRTFLTRVQPLKDAAGRVVQWFGTNTDVETLKQAENALRQSERKLREVIDGLGPNTFLGLMTPDGTLIEANRPGLVAAGVRADDVIGKPFDQTFWWSHSEPVREQLRHAMSRGAAGEASRYDVQVRVAGDALVWIDFSLTPVRDASGRVIYLVPSGNVIEERVRAEAAIRESEEHFRFLNDLSESARALTDPAQIMAVMARMLGEHLCVSRCAYAEVEKDGEHFTILHDYTDGCASTVGHYQLSLFGKRVVATLHHGQTLIIRNVEGELLPDEGADMFNAIGIRAIITCPLVKDGGLRAMMAVHQTTPREWKRGEIAIVQDVVERCWATIERSTAEKKINQLNVDLERRVTERTAQLEAANQELEAFSYSVSHDLRTPLRAMDGFSQAVMEDFGSKLPDEGRHQLKTIRESAQRMGELIDDLLTFSRLSRQALRKQSVDLAKLVRGVMDDLIGQQDERRLEINYGELPPCQGDPALLRQVWINLLSNALKYTRKRDRTVIDVGSSTSPGETVYFVRDNGTGFDMRYAHKLFGVFQRLHRAEDYEGTGVGLAIVQRVIHRHGGRVWAEATVDRGATFFFTLNGELKT